MEHQPPEKAGDYNQALMELGALVCVPNGAPLCAQCPLAHLCAAHAAGTALTLPRKAAPKARRIEPVTLALVRSPEGVLLQQRPEKGLLAGLWEYPNIPGLLTEVSAARQLAAWGLAVQRWEKSWRAKHVFTHVRWDMQGYAVTVTGDGELEWYTAEQRRQMAIPSAFERATRVLEELEGE